MRRRRTRSTRGTSFMDVLVGVLITSVTLGIAVPQIPALMQPYRLSSASRVVASQLSAARLKAIAQNRRHRINFDDSVGTYQLERETAANVWEAGGGQQQLPSGCSFAEIDTDPVFEASGMLTQEFAVEVQGSDKSQTVSINILGNVEIHAPQANG